MLRPHELADNPIPINYIAMDLGILIVSDSRQINYLNMALERSGYLRKQESCRDKLLDKRARAAAKGLFRILEKAFKAHRQREEQAR